LVKNTKNTILKSNRRKMMDKFLSSLLIAVVKEVASTTIDEIKKRK